MVRDGCTLYDYDLNQVAANAADQQAADYRRPSKSARYRFFDKQCKVCQRRFERGDPAALDGPCYDMVLFTSDGDIKSVIHRGGRNPLLRKVWNASAK